uniref:Uncharacterized protein n=1 Tax=Glossina pallidipes TaxID=7398 RepID=A0A1B0AJ76_GLOPL
MIHKVTAPARKYLPALLSCCCFGRIALKLEIGQNHQEGRILVIILTSFVVIIIGSVAKPENVNPAQLKPYPWKQIKIKVKSNKNKLLMYPYFKYSFVIGAFMNIKVTRGTSCWPRK